MKRIILTGWLGLSLGVAWAADTGTSNNVPPVVAASVSATNVVVASEELSAGKPVVPSTEEIVNALKQHYVDHEALDPKKLNDASVAGIVQMLSPGAKLLTVAEAATNAAEVVEPRNVPHESLARVEVIEPEIGYIRVGDLTPETAMALDGEFKKFLAARVSGYILDLRFADGTNYAAASAVAGRFLQPGVEVFTLKQASGTQHTFLTPEAPKTLAPELASAPLILLVNAQTRGSAEVLVAALRRQDRGIVIGSPTSGVPVEWQDVKLNNDWVLRLAATKVTFPKGDSPFPGSVIPDIMVKLDLKTEHNLVFNLQTNMTLTASLQPHLRKRAYSEAALVKVFRGESIEPPALRLSEPSNTRSNSVTLSGDVAGGTNTLGQAEEEDMAPGRDIVLQRAVDILKGIRVLLSSQ